MELKLFSCPNCNKKIWMMIPDEKKCPCCGVMVMTDTDGDIVVRSKELFNQLYPPCERGGCPFCGCMGDYTCKLYNVKEAAPHLIREHATRVNYCSRPKAFLKELACK